MRIKFGDKTDFNFSIVIVRTDFIVLTISLVTEET
jgi:hypothetical protein